MANPPTNNGSSTSPTIVFDAPGHEVDIRLQVFQQEFHVHSVVLKLHSEFFRTFLDSPDKAIAPARTDMMGFRYEWITKVDDDGSWHLVALQKNQVSPGQIQTSD